MKSWDILQKKNKASPNAVDGVTSCRNHDFSAGERVKTEVLTTCWNTATEMWSKMTVIYNLVTFHSKFSPVLTQMSTCRCLCLLTHIGPWHKTHFYCHSYIWAPPLNQDLKFYWTKLQWRGCTLSWRLEPGSASHSTPPCPPTKSTQWIHANSIFCCSPVSQCGNTSCLTHAAPSSLTKTDLIRSPGK